MSPHLHVAIIYLLGANFPSKVSRNSKNTKSLACIEKYKCRLSKKVCLFPKQTFLFCRHAISNEYSTILDNKSLFIV
ncbi:Uncharacterised protein [Chlamydia abortus]|nr:Uncharacterised protein [Chlamydia abortus]